MPTDPPSPPASPNEEATMPETSLPDTSLIDDPHGERYIDDDSHWEEAGELPRRPRRKLLAPVPVALLAVLLTACGFIAGVEVEKGQQTSPAGGGARGASAFAALRGARGAGTAGGARGSGLAGATAAFAGAATGGAGAAGARGTASGATVGEVANVAGRTLYVTTSQGNTVKVTVPAGLKASKTTSTSAHDIHPGETVIVQGSIDSDGNVEARAITIGSAAGGLGALFGGAGAGGGSGGGQSNAAGDGGASSGGKASGGGASGGGGTSSSGGEGPTVLFGK